MTDYTKSPRPPTDCPELAFIMACAADDLRAEHDVFDVILNTAVNAWLAGHIEGEDHCTGCNERGPQSHDWEARQKALSVQRPMDLAFFRSSMWHAATVDYRRGSSTRARHPKHE
ncbi:hypothetical protein ACIBL5_06470 [Streptomyces sp. NPDC050516]|uniref:hypothetical protein n=1 Tax=Streptomyces sp. NPDC050516 TaxID=3365621 RepID=UPI0037B1DC29